MKKAGKLWILDDDLFFENRFNKTGDKFEYDKLVKALRFVKNFRIAVDCGAHYGTWTRPLSKKFENVIAFEGRPSTYECIKRNIEGYNNVDLRFQAVGDRYDNVEIGIGEWKGRDGNSGIATVIGDGTTPMIPIDDLELPIIDFLKIDVEGYELFALRGAKKTLLRCKPVIIFEENRRCIEHGVERGESGQFLNDLGFAQVAKYPGVDFVYMWK